ncbi:ABC transporter [Halomonas sp. 1513]|nr:ATP-binding cassette domain-containing protein [Halomonas sp. 1513]APX94094.1 ABC transporter [Halomonas sp. 1513]
MPQSPLLRLDAIAIGHLHAVSLEIAAGDIVCLSGPSGSGKTRLLRAIADLEPHGGEAWLGKVARRDWRGSDWRQRVMLIPADSQWWYERVGEHFPDPRCATLKADLQQLGFAAETLDWDVARLSSGEKQRLGLLRAIAHRPKVLLLDEPTANLDADNITRCEAWLRQRIRDTPLAALWVAHDMQQIARVATRHLHIAGQRLEPRAWT